MLALSGTTRIVARPDIAGCSLGDSSVLLDLEQSAYFNLNAVAAEVWETLRQPTTMDAICAHLRETFDVGTQPVEDDVRNLLTEFDRLRLIEVSDG